MVLLALLGACASDRDAGSADGGARAGADASWCAEPACNPITRSGCDPDERCTYRVTSWDTLGGTMDCVPEASGTAGRGASCAFDEQGIDDCEPGLWCHPAGDAGARCLEICLPEGPDLCEPNEVCEPLEQALCGESGVCVAP